MIIINEAWINRTENYSQGDSGYYQPFTENLGKLFKSLRNEYGRCTGSIYADAPDGTPDKIGWVFQKIARYEDTLEPYLLETWVSYKWVKEL